MSVLADPLWKRAVVEAALTLLHLLLPQPRARMLYYVAEEGEGREGMAHEAPFLKKPLKHKYETL